VASPVGDRLKRTGKLIPILTNNYQTAPVGVIGVGKVQPMVVRFISALLPEKRRGGHQFTDSQD
jgi:hypothetical protein